MNGFAGFYALLALWSLGVVWSAWWWWPGSRWQFLAVVPMRSEATGEWRGLNLTWYGAISATAMALASAILLFLSGSVRADPLGILLTLILLAMAGLPASRVIVRMVEGHWHGFTVGGTMFVGLVVAPGVITGLNARGLNLPFWPVLAAILLAYAFGEACGRLACVSFGCCYGRRIDQLPPRLARRFHRGSIRYTDDTRKAVYAGHLAGVDLVPIQGITAGVFSLVGLFGLALFFHGQFKTAALVAGLGCQAWRVASETFRADDRGMAPMAKWSAYQTLALLGMAYLTGLAAWLPEHSGLAPEPGPAWRSVSDAKTLLILQGIWWIVFLHMGRSTVTHARIRFAATPPADPRG